MNSLDEVRYGLSKIFLKDHCKISLKGKDSKRFLQGQITNDLDKLEAGSGQRNCLLDRSGRIVSSFYVFNDFDT